MLAELFAIVAPIYLCCGLGFGWARLGRRYDTPMITDLVTNVGAPCLVFSSLVGLRADPALLAQMTGLAFLALTGFAVFGGLLLRMLGLPLTSFLAPLVFPNTGNMGLPVALFAFGEVGLALGVCFYSVTSLVHFTVGQWIWTGRVSFAQLARTPLAYAAALAVIVMSAEIELPLWMMRTTTLLGQLTIPLMQFTLGVSLTELHLARIPRTALVSVLRIGMGLAVGLTLAWLLSLEGAMRGVLVLNCAMPAAVVNYLLAERYGRTPSEVASVVVVSTLIAFVTLPLILAWVIST